MTANLKLGLVGYPLGYSLSPLLFRFLSEISGVSLEYGTYPVSPEAFELEIEQLLTGLDGFNVTIPYKEKVIKLLNTLDEEAEIIGAVNVVLCHSGLRQGYNTDGHGFAGLLEMWGVGQIQEPVYLLGAGGAARAVIHALYQRGIREFTIINSSIQRWEKLAATFKERFPGISLQRRSPTELKKGILKSGDLLVNCTPVGTFPGIKEMPCNPENVPRGLFYIDLIYNPPETALMKVVSGREGRAIGGLDMLIFQGIRAFQLWCGGEFNFLPYYEQIKNALLKTLMAE